jgi:glycosyltransferase 2 family protein
VKTSLWFMVLVVTVLLACFLVSSVLSGPVARWIERRSGAVRWMGRAWLELARGTEALRNPRSAIRILAHSFSIWITIALATWVGVRSVGAEVGLGAILVLMPLLALGVAVPTPSGAGSYHAAMKYGLMLFYRVPLETAVAAGVLMHLANVLPVVLLGLWFLHTERISWHDLMEAAKRVRRLGADPAGVGNGRPAEGLP